MARIRRIEITRFRGIQALCWDPCPGFNALVGPGDAGKSTILDAIDLCLNVSSNVTFTDAHFYRQDVSSPLSIRLTVGELPPELLNIEALGNYLRGYDAERRVVEDEPGHDLEDVLTLDLSVDASLEPVWSLFSERTAGDELRYLPRQKRALLGAIRLGPGTSFHTAWRQGSLLTRLTSDIGNTATALAGAAREARASFGSQGSAELTEKLATLSKAARTLGISMTGDLIARLDAESILMGRGMIALHDGEDVPIKNLGTGSLRLLVAAIQQQLPHARAIVLADEFEYGLEPHRICRLLQTLGAKLSPQPAQVFLTTHSPTVIRELPVEHLFIVRPKDDTARQCVCVASTGDVQGIVRAFPDVLLARAAVVCEGATEVGFLRGLDLAAQRRDLQSFLQRGIVLVDAGSESKVGGRALSLRQMGYQTAVLSDDDHGMPDSVDKLLTQGGVWFRLMAGQHIEGALFLSAPAELIPAMLLHAAEHKGRHLIDENIRSASAGTLRLAAVEDAFADHMRAFLGKAASQGDWYKRIDVMERLTCEVIAPSWKDFAAEFRENLGALWKWLGDVAA